MPIYEYTCPTCNEDFDLFRRFEQGHATHCPDCGGDISRRLSSFTFRFQRPGARYHPDDAVGEESIKEERAYSE